MFDRLVRQAVEAFGGQQDGLFNSAGFGIAVKVHFGLSNAPDGRWVSRVLLGLPFVVPMPGGCHWLYRPAVKHPFDRAG